jgi:hypothetical protein
MTPAELIQNLEQYRIDLIDITQRFTYFADIRRIRPGDDSKYLTLIITITDLLNDVLGENQYSRLIKKLHNESVNNDEPLMLQDVEAIIAIIDAVIARLKNNPDFYIKEEPIRQKVIPTKTKIVWHETAAFKIIIPVLTGLLLAYLVYYFGLNHSK